MALSVGVLIGGPLVRFDRSTADALHTYASEAPGLTESFHIISALGSLEALALVSLLVAMALLVRRCWSPLAAWLVAVLGGEALNLLLKDLFARPRPHFERPLVVETSYSFPSGQANEPEADRHRKGARHDDEHPGELNLQYEQSSRAIADYVNRSSLRPRSQRTPLRVLV
jgi:hypothetical protein